MYWQLQRGIIACATRHGIGSLLFSNGTDIVRWQPSLETRGTCGILSTCVITLFCVCIAIHLNVSPLRSKWELTLKKIGSLNLALLALEVVAHIAWYVCFT